MIALVCGTIRAEGVVVPQGQTTPAVVTQVPVAVAQPNQAGDTTTTADPQVHEVLDRIAAKAATIQTLQARVRYDRIQELQGDRQRRFGTLYYLAGPPAQFAAHLDQLLADRRLEPMDRWYIFDGTWLVEKIADQKPKQFVKRQIAPPSTGMDASPAQAGRPNPLALGDGPFVVPLDFNKERILARFDVTLVAADTNADPANMTSIHLRLVPRAGQRMNASQIDLWYDAETLLPMRVRSEDAEAGNVSMIDLSKVQVNEAINTTVINTDEPKEQGWDVVIKPWGE